MITAYAAASAGAVLEPVEISLGDVAPDEVLIDVMYCGICHSDLSMLDNEWGITRFPFVGGHEVVGKVVELGSAVKRLAPGDIVGLGWHAGYCGRCASCDGGDHNLCDTAQPTIVGRSGGFASQVKAQALSVVKLPEGVDPKVAGPLFCGGITVFNPMLQYGIKPTDRVGVIGIGGLGHLALKFLNAWGCEVTAFTSTDSKASEAVTLGAHKTLNSTDKVAIAAAQSRFDYLISTVNVNLDWNLYLSTLKPKGRLHFVGAVLEPINVSVFSLMGKQRSISASPVGSPDSIRQMLDFAALHKIEPQIEVFKFSQINEAIQHLRDGKARYRIVLEH